MVPLFDPLETDDLAASVDAGGDDAVIFRGHDLVLLGQLVRLAVRVQAQCGGHEQPETSHRNSPSWITPTPTSPSTKTAIPLTIPSSRPTRLGDGSTAGPVRSSIIRANPVRKLLVGAIVPPD